MIYRVLLTAIFMFLVGCGSTPQLPVSANNAALSAQDKSIGVYLDTVPEPNLALPGANCLLCLAAAATANSGVMSFAKTLDTSDIQNLKTEVIESLQISGKQTLSIDEEIDLRGLKKFKSDSNDMARRDHRALGEHFGVDQLFVIDVNAVGLVRSYANYVPTSPPLARVFGTAYVVDTTTNNYVWYEPIDIQLGVERGTWKEGPEYPSLTNAYYQVIEQLKDRVMATADQPKAGEVAIRE